MRCNGFESSWFCTFVRLILWYHTMLLYCIVLRRVIIVLSHHIQGVDKSLARPDWNKIERSPFFIRRGGHCCRPDLVGRTSFWFLFEWLAKVRVWLLWLVSFLVGLRTYQHPGFKKNLVLLMDFWNASLMWFRFPMVPLEFSIDIILPAALWPWGRLSL